MSGGARPASAMALKLASAASDRVETCEFREKAVQPMPTMAVWSLANIRGLSYRGGAVGCGTRCNVRGLILGTIGSDGMQSNEIVGPTITAARRAPTGSRTTPTIAPWRLPNARCHI